MTVARAGAGRIGSTTADGGGAVGFDYTGTSLADGTYAFRRREQRTASAPARPRPPSWCTVDTVAPAVFSVNRLNPTAAVQQRRQHHVPRDVQRERERRRRRATSRRSSPAA